MTAYARRVLDAIPVRWIRMYDLWDLMSDRDDNLGRLYVAVDKLVRDGYVESKHKYSVNETSLSVGPRLEKFVRRTGKEQPKEAPEGAGETV